MTRVPFNINNPVCVKLTSEGVRQLENYYKELYASHPHLLKAYGSIKPQEDGTYAFQLWELMRIFGPMMYMSAPNMFEDNVIECYLEKLSND